MAETKTVQRANLKQQIMDLLQDENKEQADNYASYCMRLLLEKDKKTGKDKNPFMQTKSAESLAQLFRRVKSEGLVFDGKHITLQSTGISYDYVAYKNKMLLAYPETKLDMDVVKEGDTFTAGKENGEIVYKHDIANPLAAADATTIIGAYCVLKNKRGSFITLLSKEEIAKHRKVAKTDFIWSAWFKEMVLKTVLKKACKYHFDDIFESMNEIDNETIDLDKSIYTEDKYAVDPAEKKVALETIKKTTDINELQKFYMSLETNMRKDEEVIAAYHEIKSFIDSEARGNSKVEKNNKGGKQK